MMRSTVALCVLGLLCLHSATYAQDAADADVGVLIFCDDPNAEKAVTNALDKFNENMVAGHKLAAFQVLSASKSENGSVYWLQFSARKSDCPAGSDKSWKECNYLPQGRKSPFLCNATVQMTETETQTTEVTCEIDDPITTDKANCLGCQEDIDEDSEDLKVPLSVSISKYNSMSDSSHLFTLNTVGHATRQVVAGLRFKMSFDMRKSTCAKAEHKELHNQCVPDNNDVELANCNSTVDMAPWRHEVPNPQIECDSGPLPPMLYTRRRPTGWSPLRNLFLQVPSSSSLPVTTPAPSTSPPKDSEKEESSEEDTATSAPASPASPSEAPDAEITDPFHCPGKPWKPFVQFVVGPADPTEATEVTEDVSPAPTVEGAFRDADLLGA